MTLPKAIKVLVVLVALVFGPTIAFAHGGHEHSTPAMRLVSAQSSAVSPADAFLLISVRNNLPPHTFMKVNADIRTIVKSADTGSMSLPFGGCVGTCRCQGHSNCGMGSCCYTALGTSSGLTYFAGIQSFRPLMPDTIPHPSLIFSLDRPPRA